MSFVALLAMPCPPRSSFVVRPAPCRGKWFSARARLTLSHGEILGFCANAQLNVAVRKLVAKLASQARKRKRRRVDAVRRINKFSHQSGGHYEPAAGTDNNEE